MAPLVSLTMAAANLAIWSIVAVYSIQEWRHFHDERAARGVLLALVLIAAAVGGCISALGFYVNQTTGGSSESLAVMAAVARGAVIVGGFAYAISLHERGGHHRD